MCRRVVLQIEYLCYQVTDDRHFINIDFLFNPTVDHKFLGPLEKTALIHYLFYFLHNAGWFDILHSCNIHRKIPGCGPSIHKIQVSSSCQY